MTRENIPPNLGTLLSKSRRGQLKCFSFSYHYTHGERERCLQGFGWEFRR
jgi:hypothetical protein